MRLMYILLLLSLLTGCKSKEKLTVNAEFASGQVEKKDITQTEVSVHDSSVRVESEIIGIRETETETETTIKMTEYDTSKPVVPETGKPPVFRETESTTKTKKKDKEGIAGKQAESGDVSKRVDKSEADHTTTHLSGNVAVNVDRKKERQFFRLPWIWVVIGAGIVLAGGFYLKKKFNR